MKNDDKTKITQLENRVRFLEEGFREIGRVIEREHPNRCPLCGTPRAIRPPSRKGIIYGVASNGCHPTCPLELYSLDSAPPVS